MDLVGGAKVGERATQVRLRGPVPVPGRRVEPIDAGRQGRGDGRRLWVGVVAGHKAGDWAGAESDDGYVEPCPPEHAVAHRLLRPGVEGPDHTAVVGVAEPAGHEVREQSLVDF